MFNRAEECFATQNICTCVLHHTSHDSVSVVRTTFKVYGKRQSLTLSQPKTPEPIVTKFKWRDYVMDPYRQQNLGSIRLGVFAPHIGKIYTHPVRNLLHFFGCLLYTSDAADE